MPEVLGVAYRPARFTPFIFGSTNLSGGYFPGWGIPCSLLVHQIPVVLAIFLSTLPTPPPPSPPPPAHALKPRPHVQWMYFPKLPALTQAAKQSSPEARTVKPSPAPGSAQKGLVYPGPQEIASDPPAPTNNIQTLIQPALKNAPILEAHLALPNLVLSANAGLAAPPRPLPPAAKAPVEEQPKPSRPPPPPARKPEPDPPITVSSVVAAAPLPLKPAESPDLVVSPPHQDVPRQEEAQTELEKTPAPLPETDVASAKAQQAQQAESGPAAAVSGRGSDLDTVVALSPMPSDSETQPLRLPAGEARGRFAISPRPNLAGVETEAPSTRGNASKPVVVGIEAGTAPAPAVTVNAGAGDPPASVSISFGPGPAVKEVSGVGAAASGGSAAGAGISSFAGITVTGGIDDGPGDTRPPQTRRPLQTSYGVSVVSTESSGGGLPSFGLFSNHDIYTVYVDMRETETDSDPSWILEVAVAQEPATPGTSAKNIAVAKGLVLPFPAEKRQPRFRPDVVSKFLRKLIIVYGVINVEGKMEQMSVKQTPEPALSASVLEALSQWVFRPASRNGTPFAVKVLLGIPLWSRDLAAPPRHVSISTTPPS